ncbi:MAG TPA: hypothetical protein VK943_06130 [Arenibaculum sp.]|nr:hypothetical protein [Arenibaculum sp.]
MKAPHPALPPRHEAFCRHVARGASLASAAREAGYAPSSARQRGSELYARDDVQQRIGQLTAEHAQAGDEMREDYLGRLQMVFEECMAHGERGTALRALTIQLQLRGLDARSLTRRAEAERERQAQADDLRDHLRAELYAEIRAEVLDDLEQLGRQAHGRKPPKQPQKPARAERTMTNHDVCAKPAGGLPAVDTPVPAGRGNHVIPAPAPATGPSCDLTEIGIGSRL